MYKKILFASVLLTAVLVANANHSWNNYHWARTSNSFTMKLGDNLTNGWKSYLNTSSVDWSLSSVLDTAIVPGLAGRNCSPRAGRAEICNKKYGQNGWLGIASVWVNGEHITQGTVKMNDTYFATPAYNNSEWKNLVMCQEVGHIFGLDHQDEDFANANLNTCMDYTNNPGSNQHPNAHDYAMLETLYAHLDPVTTISQASQTSNAQSVNELSKNFSFENAKEWGQEIKKSKDGKVSLFMKDFGKGQKVFTHVFWVLE